MNTTTQPVSFTVFLRRYINRKTIIGYFSWDWRTAATGGADPNNPTPEEFEVEITRAYGSGGRTIFGHSGRDMLVAARRAYRSWQRYVSQARALQS